MMFSEVDDGVYIEVAKLHASLSKAERLKVGACIVTPSRVIIPGVNGLPRLLGNVCEHDGATKGSVVHAELNCILKAQREGVDIIGSTMYITHSPCEHCASLIIMTGIARVVYIEEYRSHQGLLNLAIAGVEIKSINTLTV
jgi:dCMP deaminase